MSTLLAEVIVLWGATVHGMDAGEEARQQHLVLEGEHIASILEANQTVPAGAQVIDLRGKHLIPGLIDAAVQFDANHDALYLAAGITTVRDTGNSLARLHPWRLEANRAALPGPELMIAGVLIDGAAPASPAAASLLDKAEVELYLPRLFEAQIDFLSIHTGLGREAWKAVIELGREQGLDVWGPRPRGLSLAEVLAGGQGGLLFLDSLLPDGQSWSSVEPETLAGARELLAKWQRPLCPGLALGEVQFDSREEYLAGSEALAPEYESWWLATYDSSPRNRSEAVDGALIRRRELLADLARAGVPLIPSSHAPNPGLMPGRSLHRELREWQRAGLSPERILRAATADSAAALGLGGERGKLLPGYIADVVVLDEDPTQSLAALEAPHAVLMRGQYIDAAGIEMRLSELGERMSQVRTEGDQLPEVGAPELPEGELIMAGLCSTRAAGSLTGTERWAVVRQADGRLAFCGRSVQPASSDFPGGEMEVTQILERGALVEFRVRLVRGERDLVANGLSVAGRMQIERYLAGEYIGNESTLDRIAVLDLDSVTSALVLSQLSTNKNLPVLTFHELLSPQSVIWSLERSADGAHGLRTHLGGMLIEFESNGLPKLWNRTRGSVGFETRFESGQVHVPGVLKPRGQ